MLSAAPADWADSEAAGAYGSEKTPELRLVLEEPALEQPHSIRVHCGRQRTGG